MFRDRQRQRLVIIAVIVFVLDQLSKYFVRRVTRGFFIIPKIWKIEATQNRGIAFGIPLPKTIFYLVVFIIFLFILWLIVARKREQSFLFWTGLGLVLGGAAGNLLDRIIFGYVIDFINFPFWSTFNLADIAITCGVILLLIFYFKSERKDSLKSKQFKII